jgi:hypothetical protein
VELREAAADLQAIFNQHGDAFSDRTRRTRKLAAVSSELPTIKLVTIFRVRLPAHLRSSRRVRQFVLIHKTVSARATRAAVQILCGELGCRIGLRLRSLEDRKLLLLRATSASEAWCQWREVICFGLHNIAQRRGQRPGRLHVKHVLDRMPTGLMRRT